MDGMAIAIGIGLFGVLCAFFGYGLRRPAEATYPVGEIYDVTSTAVHTEETFRVYAEAVFAQLSQRQGLLLSRVRVVTPDDSQMPGRWYAEATVLAARGDA